MGRYSVELIKTLKHIFPALLCLCITVALCSCGSEKIAGNGNQTIPAATENNGNIAVLDQDAQKNTDSAEPAKQTDAQNDNRLGEKTTNDKTESTEKANGDAITENAPKKEKSDGASDESKTSEQESENKMPEEKINGEDFYGTQGEEREPESPDDNIPGSGEDDAPAIILPEIDI